MPVSRIFPVTALLALGLAASGCTRIPNNMGFIADEQLLASVQPGVDNKQSVQRALGRPTTMGQWDENVWYYVSRNTTQLAFLRQEPSAQNILIVKFGPDGSVTEVSRRGLEQVADITPDEDKTPTLGRETGIIEDLFGNIGTVGAVPGGGAPQ